MHQNPFGTAAGLCPDPLGNLLRFPSPLAGFTGRETPGNGLRREEEKRRKGMEKERWKWRGRRAEMFSIAALLSNFKPCVS